MARERLRLGVLEAGTSGPAPSVHRPNICRMADRVEVAAVADVVSGRVEEVANGSSPKRYLGSAIRPGGRARTYRRVQDLPGRPNSDRIVSAVDPDAQRPQGALRAVQRPQLHPVEEESTHRGGRGRRSGQRVRW
jgi:hypothetical protein